MPVERIQPEGLSEPKGYTHVIRSGNLVFLAGQAAVDSSGNLVGKDDIQAQTDQVYKNLRAALASVGADFQNVVKTTVYLTRREDLDGYRRVRAKHIPTDLPTSTLVFIDALARPEFLVEVEAIAVLD